MVTDDGAAAIGSEGPLATADDLRYWDKEVRRPVLIHLARVRKKGGEPLAAREEDPMTQPYQVPGRNEHAHLGRVRRHFALAMLTARDSAGTAYREDEERVDIVELSVEQTLSGQLRVPFENLEGIRRRRLLLVAYCVWVERGHGAQVEAMCAENRAHFGGFFPARSSWDFRIWRRAAPRKPPRLSSSRKS